MASKQQKSVGFWLTARSIDYIFDKLWIINFSKIMIMLDIRLIKMDGFEVKNHLTFG